MDLHRLTRSWTEAGVTWRCPDDVNPANGVADCPGGTWDMDHAAAWPFLATPSAETVVRDNQLGVLRFDVTADVQAYLGGGGALNAGWLLKRRVETNAARALLFAREGGDGPRLVLTVGQDTARPPIPRDPFFPDDSLNTIADTSDVAVVYYRTIVQVIFRASSSGEAIRRFLAKYQGTIVAGIPWLGEYTIRMPDPGPTWAAVRARLGAMTADPAVDLLGLAKRATHPAGGDAPRLVLTVDQDTAWPAIPSTNGLPDDASVTVPAPDDSTVLYYRNLIEVVFDAATSGATIREVFRRYRAIVVGGTPNIGPRGGYLVQIPDPGPSYTVLDSLLVRLETEAGVYSVRGLTDRDKIVPRGC